MKTLIASALVATIAAAGAVSAQQVPAGALGAIAHFNESRQGGDVVSVRAASDNLGSTRGTVPTAVFARFNADADSQDGVTGLDGATVYGATPAYGADIFDRIRAESAETE
jgi:hypothetical protein